MPANGEDAVWCLLMFDLPVSKVEQRREATRFRNFLLDEGFCMLQFSVYTQYLPFSSRIHTLVRRIKLALPTGGMVRIVNVTDSQWAKTISFCNGKIEKIEKEPEELLLFGVNEKSVFPDRFELF